MSLSLTQTKQLMDVFQFFDADQVGSISPEQFRQGMHQVARDFPAAELDRICADGPVRYEVFLQQLEVTGEDGPHSYASTTHSDALLPSTAISEEQQKHLLALIKNKLLEHGENVHESFLHFDENHDGKISPTEFVHVMNNMGIQLTQGEVQLLLAPFDANGDGVIDYQEFVRWMHLWEPTATGLNWSRDSVQHHETAKEHALHENQAIVAAQYEEAHRQSLEHLTSESTDHQVINKIAQSVAEHEMNLRKKFQKWDKNGSGDLDLQEFKGAMAELGYDFDDDLARHVFNTFDVKHDGRIKYFEFIRTLGTADHDDFGAPQPSSDARRPIQSAVELSEHLSEEELMYARLAQIGDDEDLGSVVSKIRDAVEASPKSLDEIFRLADPKGRGSINPMMLKGALAKLLGLNISLPKAEQLVGQYDKDRDGRLSLKEWKRMLAPNRAPTPAAAPVDDGMSDDDFLALVAHKISDQGLPVHRVFQMMCPDGGASGSMSQADLKDALEVITGTSVSDERAARLFQRGDIDGDGRVSAWEFTKLLAEQAGPAGGSRSASPAPQPQPQGAGDMSMPGPAPAAAAAPAPAPAPVQHDLQRLSPQELLNQLSYSMHTMHIPLKGVTRLLDPNNTGNCSAADIQAAAAEMGLYVDQPSCLGLIQEYNPDGEHVGGAPGGNSGSNMTMPCWQLMQLLGAREAALAAEDAQDAYAEHQRQLEVEREARRKQMELHMAQLTPEQRRAVQLRDNDVIARLREDLFEKHRAMKTMFTSLDRDDSGALTAEELQRGFERAGMGHLDMEECERILSYFDRDHDGQLSFNEFERLLQKARDIAVHETGVRDMAHLGGEAVFDGFRESVAIAESAGASDSIPSPGPVLG